jgi:hypothetical protein
MLQHGIFIFCQHPEHELGVLGQVRCLTLLACCQTMNMKLSLALSNAVNALLICKNIFWPHTIGDTVAYHLSHLWTVERLQATEKRSALCKKVQTSTVHVSNTKLQAYHARRVAQVAAQAFVAYSRASSDLQSAMTCACNAVLCMQFATGGQGITATLAWCQVCTCATMRLLQKQGHRWQILQPWDVQPALSHHALIECICEHAVQKPQFRKSISSTVQLQSQCDVGTLHDETEVVFVQFLNEIACRGVQDMQHSSVQHLWKRCNRHFRKHRHIHPEADLQHQLVLSYLLVIEV